MKARIIALVLLCFSCQFAFAQHDFKKVDAWLDANADKMGGRVMLMVYQNWRVVYSHSVNNMNIRQKMVNQILSKRMGRPVDDKDYTADTRQPIASCSKWLSAALVMTFVDEGKLKLTDTVGKFLPVLSKSGKGKITVGQCLSHQTGINTPSLKDDLAEMKDNNTMDDAMADIAKMPMEGEPGKVFHYSNAGLQIAGAVIEKISGKSFQQLFAERIAKPLNMPNTDFGTAKVALPAGGGISTPNDYINFLVMIMSKGLFNGKRILSENSIAQMQINRLTPDVKISYSPAEAGTFGYAYGEWVMGNGSVSSPGLFGSFPWVNNDKKYCAFMMTFYVNNSGRNARYKDLMQLVNDAVN